MPQEVNTISSENIIREYKNFYHKYLKGIKNRYEILNTLNICISKYDKVIIPEMEKLNYVIANTPEIQKIHNTINNFLIKHISQNVFDLYNQEIEATVNSERVARLDNKTNAVMAKDKPSVWEFVGILGDALFTYQEHFVNSKKAEMRYKYEFLKNLYSCIYYFGLHPNIWKRSKNQARYNILVEHYFRSRKQQQEIRLLLPYNQLTSEYLLLYGQQKPLYINGKLIPFDKIYSIKITSTILMDDEIELFSLQNNFVWNDNSKDELIFLNFGNDETNNLLKNPYLKDLLPQMIFKNQSTLYVSDARIKELQTIKKKDFDLTILIQYCNELNTAAKEKNYLSITMLVRAIIDHVPSVFKCSNFAEVANNYAGSKSFKKSMTHLDNSLRNIADNHLHKQISKKEVLPTDTQVDFSNDLDVLLAEVYKLLK